MLITDLAASLFRRCLSCPDDASGLLQDHPDIAVHALVRT